MSYQKGSYPGMGHNVYLVDLDNGDSLGLMGLPKELDYNPETSWAILKPYGKNTANYHFTGAEDTLEMEISWWSTDEDHLDILSRCKWVEAASKNDGDLGRPKLIRLIWGQMFLKTQWIIFATSYKLTDFVPNRGSRPSHATQKLVLKRWQEDNRTSEQIMDWKT